MTALERVADEWNQAHPIGTPVTYWTGVREGNGRYAVTRTEARVFGAHTQRGVSKPGCPLCDQDDPS